MSERDTYPAGVPCWVDTLQRDAKRATAFYGALFGWEFAGPGPMPDGAGEYFVARLRGRDVAGVGSIPPSGGPSAPIWVTHVAVESADAAAEKARRAGGSVVMEPFDVAPAGRIAVLADPSNASFCVWEAKARHGAQIVNETGAWTMSLLYTRDPEEATRFYHALFGWNLEMLGDGENAFGLFRLPGYVGGEAQQPVPRDNVACMVPHRFPQHVPPHWGVDFHVDDTDATAQRAAELGGKVLVPPFPTPFSRSAVLADPQGAPFAVHAPANR